MGRFLGFVGTFIVGFMAMLYGQTVSTGSTSRSIPGPRILCKPSDSTLIRIVKPIYPENAINQKLQGKVLLELLVNKAGVPVKVTVLLGDPILADSAIAAVKNWRYKPLLLNGTPVEISTKAEFNFVLPVSRNQKTRRSGGS